MFPEKWLDIKTKILDNFKNVKTGFEHLEEEGGIDVEFLEFYAPLGLIRLEYIIKPAIIDKKVIYSNRIGSETKIEYVYSLTEKTYQLNIYKWNEDLEDWEEVNNNFLKIF